MADESAQLITIKPGPASAQELLDTAFNNLTELGAGEGASHLFPNGIGSLELDVDSGTEAGKGFRLALRISAPTPVAAVAAVAATPVLAITEEDDTHLTFNVRGHHVIAQIAMADLEARLPAVAARVQAILDAGDRTLNEAATFPDDIRNEQPETKPFHFIDIPFRDNGPVNPPLPNAPHVISKIDEFSQFFRNGGGTDQENVDALSWLIHMFGDIHQPLHCIEHISELHPTGDRGGNSFRLKGTPKNLHSAWDGSVDPAGQTDEQELAVQIADLHTRGSLATDLAITDPVKWARATFRLAKKHAYSIEENPDDPPKLSSTYVKTMQKVGRRQAALAGYRLSDRLEALFQ